MFFNILFAHSIGVNSEVDPLISEIFLKLLINVYVITRDTILYSYEICVRSFTK